VQRGELLVEMAAQPRQLLGLAQLSRLDHLVELAGVDTVGRRAGVRAAPGRPPRIAVGGRLLVAAEARLVGAVELQLGRLLGARLGRLIVRRTAQLDRLVRGFALGLRLHLLVVGVVGAGIGVHGGVVLVLVGEVEMGDQLAQALGIRCLVVDLARERLEVVADPLLEPPPPQVAHVARGLGRAGAGQALAQQQADHLDERRVLLVVNLLEALRPAAGGERGGEVVRHRVVDRLRDLAGGAARAVDVGVVVALAQRQSVGLAAHLADLRRAELARRHPQQRPLALEPGAVGAEHHLELAVAGDRPGRARDRALERLRRQLPTLAHGG
jgi:hypothetical protein